MGQHLLAARHRGAHLSGLIAERGVSAQTLADQTALSAAQLEELLSGTQILTADAAFFVGDALSVSPLELLEGQSRDLIAARDEADRAQAA